MDNSNIACPICTLFLREGVTLQAHLDTHPKEQVIEALLKVSNGVSSAQMSTAPSSNSSYVQEQSISNSNSSYMSQPPQALLSINPQSQMTTAVTYQHFMTSNGSAILPQYIQVPMINPSGNIPVISNSMNFVPNQTVNYSQTAYNPLYNPYIPQPYPFNQPVFTSFPVSSLPTTDSNTQSQTSNIGNDGFGTVLQSSVLVKKCSVATSTDINKKINKTKCKKTFLRHAAIRRKVKLMKQKLHESTHFSRKNVEVAKSCAIKISKSKSSATSSNTNVRIISPPPLTPAPVETNSLSSCQTSSPSFISKPPYFELVNLARDVDVVDSGSAVPTKCIINDKVDYTDQHQNVKNVSVCEDSGGMIKIFNNEVDEPVEKENEGEKDIKVVSENSNEVIESKSHDELAKDPLELDENVIESNESDQDEEEIEKETDKMEDKVFDMVEVIENKVDILNSPINQDIPQEIRSENIERNCDGSDIFIQQENILFHEDSQKEKTNDSAYSEFIDVQIVERLKNHNRSENQNEYNFYNERVSEGIQDLKQGDTQPVTYTDLQPAKSSRVFQDLDISPYLNFSNYMEVDGIKIFFNNNSANLPFDPIVKISNLQNNGRNISTVMKAENQLNNHTIVDSVIQIVSGENESKRDLAFRENYRATTSQVNDIQLDLPDLSPLALNIQADESMPARGELSEQESLGAENSSWNLFHGNNTNDIKSLEEWRNSQLQSVSVIGNKKGSKAFKCAICNEVFSCPKERRVHKNRVHLNKSEKTEKCSSTKKQKTYACSFCSNVFTCLRDRKAHVFQNHYPDLKNKKSSQIKEENSESVQIDAATVKNETVQESNVKTEQAVQPTEVDSHRVKYCSRCSLPFMGMKKLREHLRLAHGEIRYKCESCSACFDEETEYNDHLLIHPLVCDKCGKAFHKRPNLNLHMKRHLEVKPYECSLCPKSFITRQKLGEHMNGHSGKKPIKCSLCDKTFSRHSNLIQHRNLHHLSIKKKIKDFVCRCGEVFHSLRKLEWHKEIHETKPKPCPFCSQKFIHSASVTRHIRRAHLPDYLPGENREFDNVQCPICEKIYLRSSLVVHMRVHNGEKPFACKICNKRFSTKWNLELHNWTHQSRSNMPYKCTICKSAFFRESDFVAHVNSHRNYKPFTCNTCGQKFIRKYSCLRHQEEHKKSKQYVCGVNGCAKSFHRGYYLRDHMKIHTGVRPHTCHICGKASSTKSNHNKHVRIHDTREPVNTEN